MNESGVYDNDRNISASQDLQPIPDRLVVLTFDDGNKSDATYVAPLLKSYGFGGTFFITEGLNFLKNKDRYVTWEEVKELHEAGFEIGNHTRHHKNVNNQSSEELLADLATYQPTLQGTQISLYLRHSVIRVILTDLKL